MKHTPQTADGIRDKIKKLLALATSPEEGEAKAALLKAKELMAKHKIDASEFEQAEKQELVHITCEDIKWTTDSGEIWMVGLAKVLCDNFVCVSSWMTRNGTRTHRLVISGFREDVDICRATITYAVGFVRGHINILQHKHPNRDSKAIASSYANGFVAGLEMSFEMQKDEHPEWGLVVVKPPELMDYANNLQDRTVKTKKADFDPMAYLSGQTDGANFNKTKVIANT